MKTMPLVININFPLPLIIQIAGKRLYNFLKVSSDNKNISYDFFQDIGMKFFIIFPFHLNFKAEILIKDSFEGYKGEYSTFDKMEIFAVISIGQKIKKKEDLHDLDLTYIEAIQFVKDFLLIFNLERINSQIDEFAVLSLLNNIFGTIIFIFCLFKNNP